MFILTSSVLACDSFFAKFLYQHTSLAWDVKSKNMLGGIQRARLQSFLILSLCHWVWEEHWLDLWSFLQNIIPCFPYLFSLIQYILTVSFLPSIPFRQPQPPGPALLHFPSERASLPGIATEHTWNKMQYGYAQTLISRLGEATWEEEKGPKCRQRVRDNPTPPVRSTTKPQGKQPHAEGLAQIHVGSATATSASVNPYA